MKPTENIVLHWKDNCRRQHSLKITREYLKNYLLELAEEEMLDKVRDVYYTIGNITHKLDYYNCREII